MRTYKKKKKCPKKLYCQKTSPREAKKIFGVGLRDDGDLDESHKYAGVWKSRR